MPIAPLPETTVRAIGSSQVLTDSASVVKELVDNALDARASSVVVEISTNALDVIQVKDNGHGIASEDRALVCQRYCTSKIRDFSDVSKIGGTSLGFRGEALASAVEMSGSVIVTTRIEGETVATSMTFGKSGKLLSQDSVSHPVGTTVRIIDFLKHMPVRKQVAQKTAAKTSSKIKDVLKAYALARPLVRLSLKVLKAKSDKENWMYAPKAGATVADAVMKIINQRAVVECAWHVWSTDLELKPNITAPASSVDGEEVTECDYIIESLLPRKQCDIAAISNAGQYVSIDSRPVSCTRGTLKEIVAIYKSYLKSASSIESHKKLVSPFLYLNVCCPPGSYDPNLEPAKDNVLFTDAEGVLRIVERFFTDIYGEREITASKGSETLRHQEDQEDGFELLLNRKPKVPEPVEVPSNRQESNKPLSNGHGSTIGPDDSLFLEESSHAPALTVRQAMVDPTAALTDSAVRVDCGTPSLEEPQPRRSAWTTMYDQDEDTDTILDSGESPSEMPEEYDEPTADDIKHNNPWTIAKMNASIKPKIPVTNSHTPGAVEVRRQSLTPARTGTERNVRNTMGQGTDPASPPILRESNPLTHLPSAASTRDSTHEFSSPTRLPFSTNPWARHRNSMDNKGPADLHTEGACISDVGRQIQNKANTSGTGFVSARSLPIGTPLTDIPDVPKRPRKHQQRKQEWQQKQVAGLHQPFVPPINRSQRAWSETPSSQQHSRAQNQQQHRTTDDLDTHSIVHREREALREIPVRSSVRSLASMHPDLAVTLDFESRKEAAMQKRKAQLRQQTLDQVLHRSSEVQSSPSTTSNSPHKNRYNKAIAALNSTEDPVVLYKSAFGKSDPRHYLARDLQAEAKGDYKDESPQFPKLKRRKTAHMPFESIPAGEAVHNLMMTIDATKWNPFDVGAKLAGCDEYIRSGKHVDGFDCTMDEARSWDAILQNLIESKVEKEHGHTQGVSFDIWALLRQHDISREGSVAISET